MAIIHSTITTNFWNSKFTDWLMAFGGLATIATLIYLIVRGSRDRFETKFFELLRLHKANVDEMNIADTFQARKCFVPMFYELKECYSIVDSFYNSTDDKIKKDFEYEKINLMDLSYRIFFYGIGTNSEKHFISFLGKGASHLFDQVRTFLEIIRKEYTSPSNDPSRFKEISDLPDLYKENKFDFFYLPFDGHVNRLGHYYRHIFQTANYVISKRYLSKNGKYGYMKILRAQLSNFEQLLLYYNAMAWFEDEWKIIFTQYRFIKNIPLPLADFYIKPEDYFEKEIEELKKKGIAMFEWQEGKWRE